MTTESRSLVVVDPQRAAVQLKARFDKDLTIETAKEFVDVCALYGLDPFMGEMVPYFGRAYVTLRGVERKIAERFPGQLLSITADMAVEQDYKRFRIAEGDWLAFAIVHRVGLQAIKRYALVRAAEVKMKGEETDVKRRHLVNEPWDMAMKRAKHRALREAFPDAISLEIPTYEAIEEGEQPDHDVIDTTAREVTDERAPTTADNPPAAAPEGPPVDEKGPVDPEDEERKRFWATAKDLGYKTRSPVHTALGLAVEEGAIKNVWLPKADKLGIPRPRAWAIATSCLEQIAKLMADGESREAAIATVEALAQLDREAQQAERERQEALPLE